MTLLISLCMGFLFCLLFCAVKVCYIQKMLFKELCEIVSKILEFYMFWADMFDLSCSSKILHEVESVRPENNFFRFLDFVCTSYRSLLQNCPPRTIV